jgi:hypothetical protein
MEVVTVQDFETKAPAIFAALGVQETIVVCDDAGRVLALVAEPPEILRSSHPGNLLRLLAAYNQELLAQDKAIRARLAPELAPEPALALEPDPDPSEPTQQVPPQATSGPVRPARPVPGPPPPPRVWTSQSP